MKLLRSKHFKLTCLGLSLFGFSFANFPAHAAFGRGGSTSDLEARITKIENLLRNQLNIDNLNRLEALQTEIQSLRGKLEEQDYQIKLLSKQQFGNNVPQEFVNPTENTNVLDTSRSINTDLEFVLGATRANTAATEEKANIKHTQEDNASPEANHRIGSNESSARNNRIGNKVSITAKSLYSDNNTEDGLKYQTEDELKYKQAYNALKVQDFHSASTLFSNFLWKYPDSKYVADAYFWLGEINLVNWQQDNSDQTAADMAELSFSRIVKLHQEHARVKDAILKLGILAENLGKHAEAKNYYNRVVEEFPDTPAASLAKTKLQQL